jgi:hypothetical protein
LREPIPPSLLWHWSSRRWSHRSRAQGVVTAARPRRSSAARRRRAARGAMRWGSSSWTCSHGCASRRASAARTAPTCSPSCSQTTAALLGHSSACRLPQGVFRKGRRRVFPDDAHQRRDARADELGDHLGVRLDGVYSATALKTVYWAGSRRKEDSASRADSALAPSTSSRRS